MRCTKKMSQECHSEFKYYGVLESDMSRNVQRDFDQISGYTNMKNYLFNHFVDPQKLPHWSEQVIRPLLICGHPGVGKSVFIEAIAHLANKKLFVFNMYSLGSSTLRGVGSSEDCIKAVFTVAHRNRPCILCLEDIDVLSESNESYGGAQREVLLQLFNMCKKSERDVTVVATTQKPWNCNVFLLGHFHLIFLDLPTCEERIEIFKRFISDMSHDLNDEILAEIGNRTHGFATSDLMVLARQACVQCVRKISSAQYFKKIYIPLPIDKVVCETLEKLEPDKECIQTKSDQVLYKAGDSAHRGEEKLQSFLETSCGLSRREVKFKDNHSYDPLLEDSVSRGEGQAGEKFTPCESWEVGASKTSFLEIPAELIWHPLDVTKESLMISLIGMTSSITDELEAKMKHFKESYYHAAKYTLHIN
ncbi:unnamed protein product [Lymnaea stagnalis]|uniref:AAA+ ATPase domain-containing protein n=1 Tax=Lymnaea stagnalis TaxID=6523 RepID=A0AAV2IH07_LYMST